MTTTPTAVPELPDLARLEALARAADQGEGQHIYTNPRDSNGWQANEAWHRAASPAAVLALIALARRAQPEGEARCVICGSAEPRTGTCGSDDPRALCKAPAGKPEGEAPQAEKWQKLTEDSAINFGRLVDVVLTNGVYEYCRRFNQVDWTQVQDWRYAAPVAPAATLSPLCGAQHAESGKEVSDIAHSIADRVVCYELKTHSAIAAVAEAVLRAAQQAAAPGALPMTYDEFFAEARRLGCKLPADVCAALAAAPDYSAPGTPEAPSDQVRLDWLIENDAMVYRGDRFLVARPNRAGIEGWGFGDTPRAAIDRAMAQRAAQLDGGQEGSGS